MTAKPQRSRAPVWLMGLTNSVFGMYGGIIAISVPQLLSARHVPESRIAAMSAVMVSPGFWTFLVSPVLDVRFSRRTYSLLTAGAFNIPVTYMLFVDGAGYAQHGLAGSYAADAGVSLVACVLLAAMLIWQGGARRIKPL
jgi:hypothetical protein